MFCGKCGAKNADNAQFCGGCGEKLEPIAVSGVEPETAAPHSAQSSKNNKMVGIAAVAVIAVVVIALLVSLLGGGNAEKTAIAAMDAMLKPDMHALLELVPEAVIEEEMGAVDKEEVEQMCDDYDEMVKSMYDRLKEEVGDDWSMDYEVISVIEADSETLADIREDYADYDITIKELSLVEVAVTIAYGEQEQTTSLEIPVFKVGGSWYVDMMNMDSLF